MGIEFDYKSTGAIVVPLIADISVVEGIIKDMDEDEFTGYYPEGLVTVDGGGRSARTTYMGKFSVDLVELYRRCKKVGITISALQQSIVETYLNIKGD